MPNPYSGNPIVLDKFNVPWLACHPTTCSLHCDPVTERALCACRATPARADADRSVRVDWTIPTR